MQDLTLTCTKWGWLTWAWWGWTWNSSLIPVHKGQWWSHRLHRRSFWADGRQFNFNKYSRIPSFQHRGTLPFRSKLRGINTEKISRISGNRMRQKPIHSFSGWTVLSPKLYDHWGDSCCNHRHSNEALHHPWEHWNRWACQMLVHFRGRIFLNGTNSGH